MDIKQFLQDNLDIVEGVPFCIKERDSEDDYDIPNFYVYENNKIYNMTEKKYDFANKEREGRPYDRFHLHSKTVFVSSVILKRSSRR